MFSGAVTSATAWADAHELAFLLVVLILLDVATGLVAAIAAKKLDSGVSWHGMSRKVMTIGIVVLAMLLEPLAQGLPLEKLVCLFYIVTESLSILENAGRSGVPLPPVLKDVLAKLNGSTPPERREATS